MTHVGMQCGGIRKGESRIIQNLFRFDALTAKDVMTPRTVITALDEGLTIAEASETIGTSPFSRFPVYGENRDDMTGLVLKDDILLHQARGGGKNQLSTLKRDILAVPSVMPLSGLFSFFLGQRSHMALVVDEYGGTEGLVTLEDVVETLLGIEIMDEMDEVPDMRVLARKQWEKRAKKLRMSEDR
jgi:CBS domain containing-hemolysin-like protein